MKLIIITLLIMLLVGCSSSDDSKIIHPTKKNLPSEKLDNIINAQELNINESNSKIKRLVLMLDKMQKTFSIGKLYGEEEEMFGFIEDVVIDSFNRIYVLDSNKQLIYVFNAKGKFITTVGRQGEGPGEFEGARSMANYNDKLLLASNGYRIEVFDIQSKKIEFVETISLKKWVHSICTLGNTLFVHNTRLLKLGEDREENNNISMIHAYKLPSFKPLFSFGQSYKSSTPMVVNRMSAGSIGCNESSSTVIFAFEQMPVLHGYSAKDGSLKWKSRIEGLHYANIIQSKNEKGKTRITFQIPESKTLDRIYPTVTLENGYEVLQVRRIITPDESYETKREVLSFILNSADGKATLVSKEIPGVVNLANNFILTVSGDFTTSQIFRSEF